MGIQIRPTRVLLVENDEEDFYIVREFLSAISTQRFELEWVNDYDTGLSSILHGKFDACFLDYQLDERSGLELLKEALASGCEVPLILLTGQDDYHIDLEAMQSGASDFLPKAHLSPGLLERSIRYAVERTKAKKLLELSYARREKEVLEQSEDKYRTLFETMVQGVVYRGSDGAVIDANPAAERILGLTLDQMQGRTSIDPRWKAIHEDGTELTEGTNPSMVALMTGREVRDSVMGIYDPQHDRYRWVNVNAIPQFRSGEDIPHQVYTTLEDITERKQTEQRLAESECKYRTLLEDASDAIILADAETGIILEGNRQATVLTGWSADELKKMHHGELHPPHENGTYCAAFRERLSSPGKTIEILVLHRDGRHIPVEVTASTFTLNGRLVLQGIFRDITERRQAEETLRESEEKFRTIFHANPDPIVIASLSEGRNLDANDAYVKFTGLSRSEVLGKTAGELGLWCREGERNAFRSMLKTEGKIREFEASLQTRHGIRTVLMSGDIITVGDCPYMVIPFKDITERKQAEEVRTRLRTQLANALEIAHLGPWEYDVAADVFTFTDQFYKIFRTSASKVGGYTMSSLEYASRFVHPEDMHFVAAETRQAIETTDPDFSRKLDHRIVYEDGTVGYVSVRFFIVKDSRGNTVRTYGVNQDITERRLAEKALRDSEAQFKAMFEMASIGLAQTDTQNHQWLRVNQKMCEITGYSSDELLGMRVPEITHPEDRERDRKAFQNLVEGRSKSYRMEKRYIRKDGAVVWVNVNMTVIRKPDGTPVRTMATIEDITERKRSEEALAHSHDLMRYIIEHNRSAVAVHDRDLKYIYVSQRYLDEYNVKDRNVIGKHHYEVFPDLPQKWKDVHQKALAGEIASAEDDPYERDDGSVEWTRWECRPWYESDGSIGGIIVYTEVITDRKQAEEERERLSAQLLQAQKMESVGRLAGGVAHDFNNMLGVIIGRAELALHKSDSAHSTYNDLQEIRKAGHRSADLVRQLLAFARKQTASPKILNINETVESMLRMVRRLIGEDIELLWRPGANIWPVKVDPTQVDQVLANLCVNARDAIAGVGKVIIETGNVTLDDAYCRNHEGASPGDYVFLSLNDSGCGMDKETTSKVFEPFFTTKEVGKGTGLGLATVYGIVKQNNGFIDVHSEPGRGTTFRIYLPPAGIPTEEEQRAGRQKRNLDGNETVLLVEDEEAILVMGKTILERYGYTVLATRSPDRALAIAQNHPGPLHLLVTDIVMPEMNGRHLRDRLKTLKPAIKCIFMSGYTADVIAHHGVLDEGVNFLQKPFSVRTLAEKVREVLDG